MTITRNQPCPCGSGERYKSCCATPQKELPAPTKELACSLVDRGNLLLEQGLLKEARDLYLEALNIAPRYFRAHYNLGVVLRKLGRNEEAAASYQQAIAIEPRDDDTHYNLGVVLRDLGELEDAAASFRKAIALKPDAAETHFNLGVALRDLGKLEDAAASFRQAIQVKPDYPNALNSLALIAWLNKDWETCRQYRDLTATTATTLSERDAKSIIPYYNFLGNLLNYKEQNPECYLHENNLRKIYAVGDSHCLSIAHTEVNFRGADYQVEPKIIVGCKAWHLANTHNNNYKCSLREIARLIPTGSIVITMFGEIDCRRDEGIIKHHRKNNPNLSEAIIGLVENYINYQVKIFAAENISLIICNVPAPLFKEGEVSADDKKLQDTVVKEFNLALADNAAKRQIPILDVYTASKNSAGTANDKWHLDNIHLRPEIYRILIKKLN